MYVKRAGITCLYNSALDEIFLALLDFKDNMAARNFIIGCLKDDDMQLCNKAHTTISMWSYSGMPELRAAGLLDALKAREERGFGIALQQLKLLLFL